MMQAVICVSTNLRWLQAKTLAYANQFTNTEDWEQFITTPDTYYIEATKAIGIDMVRSITAEIAKKPFQEPITITIINALTTITPEAQNAFLKTLEEPPPHALLVLWVARRDHMLPTVLSRCVVYEQNDEPMPETTPIIADVFAMSVSERLVWAKQYNSDQTGVKAILLQFLAYHRTRLLTAPTPQARQAVIPIIAQLTKLLQDLDKKVQPKLCLDMALMAIPS